MTRGLLALSAFFLVGGCVDRSLDEVISGSGLQEPETGDEEDSTASFTTASEATTASSGPEPTDTGPEPPPDDCHEWNPGGLPEFEFCKANEDCASYACFSHSQAPWDSQAMCISAPPDCLTFVTGRVRFFFEQGWQPDDSYLKLMGAIGASVNPFGAESLGDASSYEGGWFEMLSYQPLEEPLGVVVMVESPGGWPTLNIVAQPKEDNTYGAMNSYRDVFATSEDTMWQLSEMLWQFPEFEPFLPLGEQGGVIGIVRDAASGSPMSGVEVYSASGGNAFVAYPNFEDWGAWGNSTSSSGLFVIMNPAVGEEFYADAGPLGESEPKPVVWSNGVISALPFEF